MVEKLCAGCKAEMDPDAIFCNECGHAQPIAAVVAPQVAFVATPEPALRACPQCGNHSAAGSKFCSKCAFDLSSPAISGIGLPECPGCKRLYTPDDKFCRHCAFDLTQVKKASSAHFCTGCGTPFDSGDRFCRNCSADISQSDHTVAMPVVSAPSFQQAPSATVAAAPPILSVAQPNNELYTDAPAANPPGPHWISPSGAAFVVICFFLPWVEWSCFGSSIPVSGAQLANRDASFLIFPLAAIITIIVYFVFKAQKTLWKARPFIIVSSAIALLLLFYKVNSVPSASVFGTTISASDLGFKPQIGGFGTIIGYIAAMVGCAFMSRRLIAASAGNGALPGDGWFEPGTSVSHSANWFGHHIASLKANKAAMLCYLSPLLLQIVIGIFSIFLVGILGGVGFFINLLLSLSAPFAGQILFLKKEPHRSNLFVRFHAFQSLLLMGTSFAGMLMVIGLVAVTERNSFGERASFAGLLMLLVYAIAIGNLILTVLLAVKANRNELYKLPYIGDLASKFAPGEGINLSIK